MIDKQVHSLAAATAGIEDGATLLVSGFGGAGSPVVLLDHLSTLGLRDLTVVTNNAGAGTSGLAALLRAGSVRRLVASYPRSATPEIFDLLLAQGRIELELVPQGTLSERIRAGGSGIGAFFTPTGVGTMLAGDRETREFPDGSVQVLEPAIRGDFALLAAARADRWGNLVYDKAQRNYGPTMAMAAAVTVVEVSEVVPLGSLDPEHIVTPGVFTDRLLEVPRV